jgi:hypothetical protein
MFLFDLYGNLCLAWQTNVGGNHVGFRFVFVTYPTDVPDPPRVSTENSAVH